ncbi:nuclear transport factor 2 family protein [Bradyrhizobium lablabi]|uniref:nuclear transport factor 2 family protein n=1 Tax=Bradyrhizobium lablabi TaxID=722472 RepID=UPI001BABCF10|nr:nuclear transport factor 2 family protein [Bradyrhizobium lablabi]MBR0691748.1 nuclear transport factor 2 family protein [Bradyrhizobium lablabi]
MSIDGVIARLYLAYNAHDAAAVAALYAPDATHEDIAQGKPKHGPDEIAAGLGRFFSWFPDAHWAPQHHAIGASGVAAVSYLLTATLKRQFGPIAPRDQAVSLRGVHMLQIRDGLIRRSEDYWDAATFQRQLNHVHERRAE